MCTDGYTYSKVYQLCTQQLIHIGPMLHALLTQIHNTNNNTPLGLGYAPPYQAKKNWGKANKVTLAKLVYNGDVDITNLSSHNIDGVN